MLFRSTLQLLRCCRFTCPPASSDKNPDAIPSLFRHRLSPRRLSGYGSPSSLVIDLRFRETLIVLSVFYYTHSLRSVKGNSGAFFTGFPGSLLFCCEAAVRLFWATRLNYTQSHERVKGFAAIVLQLKLSGRPLAPLHPRGNGSRGSGGCAARPGR